VALSFGPLRASPRRRSQRGSTHPGLPQLHLAPLATISRRRFCRYTSGARERLRLSGGASRPVATGRAPFATGGITSSTRAASLERSVGLLGLEPRRSILLELTIARTKSRRCPQVHEGNVPRIIASILPPTQEKKRAHPRLRFIHDHCARGEGARDPKFFSCAQGPLARRAPLSENRLSRRVRCEIDPRAPLSRSRGRAGSYSCRACRPLRLRSSIGLDGAARARAFSAHRRSSRRLLSIFEAAASRTRTDRAPAFWNYSSRRSFAFAISPCGSRPGRAGTSPCGCLLRRDRLVKASIALSSRRLSRAHADSVQLGGSLLSSRAGTALMRPQRVAIA